MGYEYWVQHTEDKNIPSWLMGAIPDNCACGSPIENFYNEAGRCTFRRCKDPSCSYMLAERVVAIAKMLDIKGIGPATALSILKNNDLKDAYRAIPYLCSEKVNVHLHMVPRVALFLKGVANEWASICEPYKSVEDFVENYNGRYASEVRSNSRKILECATYMNVIGATAKKYKPVLRLNVMITGAPKGYTRKNRDLFIQRANAGFQGLVDLRVFGQRKTMMHVLITEDKNAATGKVKAALDQGAKIMTSEEFLAYIEEVVMGYIQRGEVELC